MPVITRVYIHGRLDYREVFARCNRLIGGSEGVRFWEDQDTICNDPGQNLPVLLEVAHGRGGTALLPGPQPRTLPGFS
jgi:hypothetical protein